MRKSMVVGILGAAMWAVLGAVNPALAQCIPEWAAGFSVQPLTGPMAVYDTAVFDDGGGTCLYAAGSNGVVYKFDGVGWSSVGGRFFASTSGATGGLVYAPGRHPARDFRGGAKREGCG